MDVNHIPLVNWGMGTILIVVFALVCIIIVAVVANMMKGNKDDRY